MKGQFFDFKVLNSLENPMQKLMELNVKTMQNFSYIKPTDLAKLNKPEEIIAKQLEMLIQNTHIALNYMRDTFNILENHWLNLSRNVEHGTKNIAKEASPVKKSSKKSTSSAKKHSTTAKKATLTAKSTVKSKTKPAASTKSTSSAKATSPAKKSSAKKPVKAAVQKTKAPLAAAKRPEMKHVSANKSKSNLMKGSLSQNTPKVSNMSDKKIPMVSSLTDKSSIKDLGIQNLGKNNPLTN